MILFVALCVSVPIVQHFFAFTKDYHHQRWLQFAQKIYREQAQITQSLMVSLEIRENMPFKPFSQPSREMKWDFV